MVRSLRVIILICIVVALYSCKEKKANDIPVSEFFKSPEKSNFKISPNGKYISYFKRSDKSQNLFIRSLADGKEQPATSFTDPVRRDYNWAFDNQIIISEDDNTHNVHTIRVLDINTFKIRELFSVPGQQRRTFVLNRNKQTPDIVSIVSNKRDSLASDVYRLNIKTGDLKMYLKNPGNISEWFADADGRIRLAKATDGVDETILFRVNENSPFKPIIKNNFRNSVRPIGFTGVKNYFYALSNVGRDKVAFVEINADNGKEERVIYSNNKVDIQRVDYLKSKHRLELAAWDDAKPGKHFLNPTIEAIYKDLNRQLSGKEINISDRDTAELKFIVNTYTDRSRGSVYLYDRATDKLTKLSDNSGINPGDLCSMKPISYYAGDGLLINGYLTLPKGNDTTNLPVVVVPHDGPFGGQRNRWEYNPEVQFLASRGFAVLQVNYRGSSGYGKAFFNAGFKELGSKMQQDITDGVNWLIANKIANRRKIAIMGRGFGGFSALYGVSFYPHLYTCAIAVDAPVNIFFFIKDLTAFANLTLQKRYDMYGDPEKDAAQIRDASPVFHADKLKVPVIIYQGRDPHRNFTELDHYVSELKRRNVPVKFHLNKNERWGQTDRTRVQMYTEIEKFLYSNMQVKP